MLLLGSLSLCDSVGELLLAVLSCWREKQKGGIVEVGGGGRRGQWWCSPDRVSERTEWEIAWK